MIQGWSLNENGSSALFLVSQLLEPWLWGSLAIVFPAGAQGKGRNWVPQTCENLFRDLQVPLLSPPSHTYRTLLRDLSNAPYISPVTRIALLPEVACFLSGYLW